MGNSMFLGKVLAHDMLTRAKIALETVAPSFLHFFRMHSVSSTGKVRFWTTVCRGRMLDLSLRGNMWPPYSKDEVSLGLSCLKRKIRVQSVDSYNLCSRCCEQPVGISIEGQLNLQTRGGVFPLPMAVVTPSVNILRTTSR